MWSSWVTWALMAVLGFGVVTTVIDRMWPAVAIVAILIGLVATQGHRFCGGVQPPRLGDVVRTTLAADEFTISTARRTLTGPYGLVERVTERNETVILELRDIWSPPHERRSLGRRNTITWLVPLEVWPRDEWWRFPPASID